MTTVEALKALYVALGGYEEDVADCTTNVEVLNAISAKYDGASDATLNPVAVNNIAAIADNIGGSQEAPTMGGVMVQNRLTASISVLSTKSGLNDYNPTNALYNKSYSIAKNNGRKIEIPFAEGQTEGNGANGVIVITLNNSSASFDVSKVTATLSEGTLIEFIKGAKVENYYHWYAFVDAQNTTATPTLTISLSS